MLDFRGFCILIFRVRSDLYPTEALDPDIDPNPQPCLQEPDENNKSEDERETTTTALHNLVLDHLMKAMQGA